MPDRLITDLRAAAQTAAELDATMESLAEEIRTLESADASPDWAVSDEAVRAFLDFLSDHSTGTDDDSSP